MVELLGSYPTGRLDLSTISKALSCQGFSSKQPPPPLLQVEPTRPHGGMKTCSTLGWFSSHSLMGGLLWLERLSVIK